MTMELELILIEEMQIILREFKGELILEEFLSNEVRLSEEQRNRYRISEERRREMIRNLTDLLEELKILYQY